MHYSSSYCRGTVVSCFETSELTLSAVAPSTKAFITVKNTIPIQQTKPQAIPANTAVLRREESICAAFLTQEQVGRAIETTSVLVLWCDSASRRLGGGVRTTALKSSKPAGCHSSIIWAGSCFTRRVHPSKHTSERACMMPWVSQAGRAALCRTPITPAR
jgi:hypothetical protein